MPAHRALGSALEFPGLDEVPGVLIRVFVFSFDVQAGPRTTLHCKVTLKKMTWTAPVTSSHVLPRPKMTWVICSRSGLGVARVSFSSFRRRDAIRGLGCSLIAPMMSSKHNIIRLDADGIVDTYRIGCLRRRLRSLLFPATSSGLKLMMRTSPSFQTETKPSLLQHN